MNQDEGLSPEIDRLIAAVCDGTASDAQVAQFDKLAAENPELLEKYFHHCLLLSDLHLVMGARKAARLALAEIDAAGDATGSVEAASQVAARTPSWRNFVTRPTPLSIASAALVTSLLVGVLALIAPPIYRAIRERSPEVAPVFVAQITAADDATWQPGALVMAVNSHLQPGHEFKLEEGRAELTFRSGAVVVLEAPSAGRLISASAFELNSGKAIAWVPKRAAGFCVDTQHARITDLGTEFGIVEAESGDCEVLVYVGRVKAEARDIDGALTGTAIDLQAGQGAKLTSAGRSWKKHNDVNRVQFARFLPRPNQPKNIRLGTANYEGSLELAFPHFLSSKVTNGTTKAWNLNGDDQVINGVQLHGVRSSSHGIEISGNVTPYTSQALNWSGDGQQNAKNNVSNTGLFSSAPQSWQVSLPATKGRRYRVQLMSASIGHRDRAFDVVIDGEVCAEDLVVPHGNPWTVVLTVETLAEDDSITLEFRPGSNQFDPHPYVTAIAITEIDGDESPSHAEAGGQ